MRLYHNSIKTLTLHISTLSDEVLNRHNTQNDLQNSLMNHEEWSHNLVEREVNSWLSLNEKGVFCNGRLILKLSEMHNTIITYALKEYSCFELYYFFFKVQLGFP